MGFLKDAILYVNDRNKTGMEGFLTKYEEMYPYLPRPARLLTSKKALSSHDSNEEGQIHRQK